MGCFSLVPRPGNKARDAYSLCNLANAWSTRLQGCLILEVKVGTY